MKYNKFLIYKILILQHNFILLHYSEQLITMKKGLYEEIDVINENFVLIKQCKRKKSWNEIFIFKETREDQYLTNHDSLITIIIF